ncbi:MAG: 2-hydroxyacid dehydrogenase [Beijerinckiaceae bacterium]
MTLLVAIRGWHEPDWIERFQRLLPGREIVSARTAFDPAPIRYVACWKHVPGSLRNLPNVKALFSLGAGVDHLVGDPDLPDAPIVRMVDPDLTHRMTEWVVWQCLDWLRQGKTYRRQQAARAWIDDRDQPSAADVRIGVMGLGVLGKDAIAALKKLRFDVAGWSRSPKTIKDVPTFHGAEGMAPFLARTDILVSLLPLTPDTRGMLNAGLIAGLAQGGRLGGPVLVNAGRGGLQVEADVLAALDKGILKGASLDVFESEPLPTESLLWTHPAVIVTPHNAAMSHPDAIAGAIAEQIRTLEAGGRLKNVVDRARGY